MVLSVYPKLLGNAPEYLREINFCRATLADMHGTLGVTGPTADDLAGGKLILPDGCSTLDDAADQFLAGLAPEDLLAFEQSLQKEITRKFRGLGSICLKAADKGPRFRELLLDRSREFLDTKFDHSDPAEVFFRHRTESGTVGPLIGEAFAPRHRSWAPYETRNRRASEPPGGAARTGRNVSANSPSRCCRARLVAARCRTISASIASIRNWK